MLKDLKQYIRLVILYNAKDKYRIVAGILLAVLTQLCNLTVPFLTRFLIDDVIGKKDYDLLVTILLVSGLVLIVIFISSLSSNYILVRVFKRNGLKLRIDLIHALQNASLNFFGSTTSGEISYRISQDAGAIEDSWSSYLVTIPYQSALLISGVFMVLWQWELAIFVFILMALQILIIAKFQKPLLRYAQTSKQMEQKVRGYTVERLGKIQLMRSLVTEKLELRTFHKKFHNLIVISIKAFMLNKLGGAIISAVNNLWSFGILWYGGMQVINGDMTLGTLMAYLLLSNILYQPISTMTTMALGFQKTRASLQRTIEYFQLTPEVIDSDNAIEYTPGEGNISFKNVTFSYNSHPVLSNLNLDIESNTILALVGKSGAGKTSLCRLLVRFFDNYHGTILLDNKDIRDFKVASLRKSVLFMIQNDFVMTGTIWDNITYGIRIPSKKAVDNAAKRAGLEIIDSLPDRFDTMIGEGGINISGGEAQRIALARAFLISPRVMILDEPTSNVDSITESTIRKSLLELRKRTTIILVAHRLSTVQMADRIAVLDEGKIVGLGDHQSLMNNSIYQQIYSSMESE